MCFVFYGLRPDKGGNGEFRGGCGIERSRTLTALNSTLSILAERMKIRPWVLEEGGGGVLGEYRLIKRSGETLTLPSKCTVQIKEGDTRVVHTPGGGKIGDPRKRAPQSVLRDVLNGLVSPESAERYYGLDQGRKGGCKAAPSAQGWALK